VIFAQSPQSDHSGEYMIAIISSTFNVIAKLYLVQLINCNHENRSQCCFKSNLSFHKLHSKTVFGISLAGEPSKPIVTAHAGELAVSIARKLLSDSFFQALITKMINQESQHHAFPCTLLSGTVHFCNLALSQNQCSAVLVLELVHYSHFDLVNVICQGC
jgi:hypothetical protein